MNANEPVAWGWLKRGKFYDAIGIKEHNRAEGSYTTPLYTHPAKTEDEPNWKEMYWEMHELNHKHWSELKAHPAKTLTDEEIKQIFQEQTGFHFDDNPADDLALMDFARAILRKAQEK